MYCEASTITLSGKTFPIKMDNIVLQQIQEAYGSIENFELLLMGWEKRGEAIARVKEPSITVANHVLPKLVLEGLAIAGSAEEYSELDIVRLIDIDYLSMANAIHDELKKALTSKKDQPSKAKPKPETMTTEKKSRLTLTGFIMSASKFLGFQRHK